MQAAIPSSFPFTDILLCLGEEKNSAEKQTENNCVLFVVSLMHASIKI